MIDDIIIIMPLEEYEMHGEYQIKRRQKNKTFIDTMTGFCNKIIIKT